MLTSNLSFMLVNRLSLRDSFLLILLAFLISCSCGSLSLKTKNANKSFSIKYDRICFQPQAKKLRGEILHMMTSDSKRKMIDSQGMCSELGDVVESKTYSSCLLTCLLIFSICLVSWSLVLLSSPSGSLTSSGHIWAAISVDFCQTTVFEIPNMRFQTSAQRLGA